MNYGLGTDWFRGHVVLGFLYPILVWPKAQETFETMCLRFSTLQAFPCEAHCVA